MQPKWIKNFLILILISASLLGCAQESSEADPTFISDPSDPGLPVGPTSPVDVYINQSAIQPDPTDSFPISYRVIFSRAIDTSTFNETDILQAGTATGVTWSLSNSGNDITFDLIATNAATQGTIIPVINAGTVQDTYQNLNLAVITIDNTVTYATQLEVTIDQKVAQADPTNMEPVEFDVVFSRTIDNLTFTAGDIIQGGTAPGVVWNIINSGDDRNYTLQATALTATGTIQPSISANMVQTPGPIIDNNLASTATDNIVTYNHKVDVTVEQAVAQVDPTGSLPIVFDVVFAEAISPATFTTADITQNGTAGGITWNIINSGDNINFSLEATAVTLSGTVIPSIIAGVVQTVSLKDNTASTSTDNSVIFQVIFDVTVDQTGAQPDPSAVLPINFDVVFSTAIDPTSFVAADITQNGTATGITWNIVNSGDNINFTLQATVVGTEGTIIPSILPGVIDDFGTGTNNASTSTDNSVTYMVDFTVTIEQKGGQPDPTASLPAEYDVVFERDINPATFVVGDIIQNGTATGVTWNIINSGDNTNFTLQATAVGVIGTLIPTINIATVSDPTTGTNIASTSTDNSITVTLNFNVTIEQKGVQLDPTASLPIEFDVAFSESVDPSTFLAGDITQNGTATGVTWNILNSGDNINFTLQATATATEGTLEPSIAINSVQNLSLANNLASTSTDNSVLYNTTFDLTVDQKAAQPDPTQVLPIEFDIIFSEAIDPTSFDTTDITQNGTAVGITWNIINSGDNTNYTLQATAVIAIGTIIPSVGVSKVLTTYGANNNVSTSTDGSVTYNPNIPVTIEQKGGQPDPAKILPVEFAIVFDSAIDPVTFTTADITQNGTAIAVVWNLINSGDNINYTLQATGVTVEGTIIPSMAADVVQNVVGWKNTISSSLDNSVNYRTSFDVTIEQQGAQADPTAVFNIQWDLVFSEAIDPATFITSDITQNGAATGVTWNIINLGDNINFVIQATSATSEGSIIPSLAASTVQTTDVIDNNISTSTDNTVIYAPPFDVTIDQKGGQADPTAVLPVEFDVVFSTAIDPVTFVVADITQNGTATAVVWNIINSGDNINYTLQATAVTAEGTIIPSMAVGLTNTVVGGQNNVSTSTDNSVYYNTVVDVTIDQKAAQLDPAKVLPVEFDVVFSEAVDATTFTIADITQNGTATGVVWAIINSGDSTNFTLRATAVTTEGTLIPYIDSNLVQTTYGANNTASSSTDDTVFYRTSFDVTLDQAAVQIDPASFFNIEFDVVFSEAIDATTFISADITDGGNTGGVVWNIVNSGDNINFTLQATSAVGEGTIIPSLALNTIQTTDVINNNASTSGDNTVTYAPPFDVTVNQKAGQLDPAALTNVEFDVVFSAAINPATFTIADITPGGTATVDTWNIINSGDNINFTLQATAISVDGTVQPSIALNLVQSPLGGNNTASTATDNTVTFNTVFSVTINETAAQVDPAKTLPVEFDVIFSEAINPATFTIGDITHSGSAGSPTWTIINSGDNINFTLRATAVSSDGTLIPSIVQNLIQTSYSANNSASTSTDNSVFYRTTFDVTVEQTGAQADPTSAFNIDYDVVFSEAINPATFTSVDISDAGTATGAAWTIVNSGDNINFTLSATTAAGEGTVVPNISAASVQTPDVISNNISTSTDNSVLYLPPFNLTINQGGSQLDPAALTNVVFDVVFTAAIDPTSFTAADITDSGTATGLVWSIVHVSGNINFTVEATTVGGDGTIIPSIGASTISTVLGASNLASTSTDNSVNFNSTFDVTVEQKSIPDPKASLNVEFDVVFTEAINPASFTSGDITQSGSATAITWNIVNSGDNINFTLQATASSDGTLIPSLAASTIQTSYSANNTVSTSVDNSITLDTSLTITLTLTGANNIIANAITTTTLQANVTNSELVASVGTTVTLNIPANGGTVPGTVDTDGSGNSNFTLTSSILVGTYGYTASAGVDTSANTNVTFVVGPVANVVLALTGASAIAADATATTTFDATITDANGNPRITETVTFNIPASGGSVPGTVNTNASGVAAFTLTSSTIPGIYAYTVTAAAITSTSVNAEFKTAELTVTTMPSLDFPGPYFNNPSPTQEVIITNTGLMNSGVISSTMTGNNGKHLQFTVNNCDSATLTPTQTCNIIFFLDGADNPGGAKAETHTVTAGPGGTIILNLTGVD